LHNVLRFVHSSAILLGRSNSFMILAVVDPRQRSLFRSTLLVLGSLAAAIFLSGYPEDRPSLKLCIPLLIALAGFVDTFRCLRMRWSLYHGAVVVMLYMEVLALSMILFLFLYPYGNWIM
jgi:hypothetical protein